MVDGADLIVRPARGLTESRKSFGETFRACIRCGAALPRNHAGTICPLFCIGRVLGRGRRDLALELVEVKAVVPMELLPATSIAPFTRLAGVLSKAHEGIWRELLGLELGPVWSTFGPRSVPTPIVLPCDECGRWNYHLAGCSRRGLR